MCLEELLHDDIKNLAYKFYVERNQNIGSELEDWLKAKNVIFRTMTGVIYLSVGAIFLCFANLLLRYFLSIYWDPVIWCISWSMVGIGAGLINTRNKPQSNFCHLVFYWSFVALTVSLFAFTISIYVSGEDYPNLFIKFYSLAALLSLLGGFLGDIFRDLVLNIIKNNRIERKS